jgi:hypothetical protein
MTMPAICRLEAGLFQRFLDRRKVAGGRGDDFDRAVIIADHIFGARLQCDVHHLIFVETPGARMI